MEVLPLKITRGHRVTPIRNFREFAEITDGELYDIRVARYTGQAPRNDDEWVIAERPVTAHHNGQLSVPAAVRRALSLEPGDRVALDIRPYTTAEW